MSLDNSQFNETNDISRFLEKFSQDISLSEPVIPALQSEEKCQAEAAIQQAQYNQSFEKLEEKIRELEEKFEVSAAQHEAVMHELARTRKAVENQQSKDSFFANITSTIENLKQSVENLSRAQRINRTYTPASLPNRAFDVAMANTGAAAEYMAMSSYLPDNYRVAQQSKLQEERREKEEAVSALQTVQEEKAKALATLALERGKREKAVSDLEIERKEKEKALSDLSAEKDSRQFAQAQVQAVQTDKEKIQAELNITVQSRDQALSQLIEERKAKEQALSDLDQVRQDKEQVSQQLKNQQQEKEQVLADLNQVRQDKEQISLQLQNQQQEKEQALVALQSERSAREQADSELAEEREEKNRVFSSLQQKTSQLKAVNVALDREIKRVQQEKMEALRKSAEQAKEILSLRDALTQAEENFKSFNFEGRIISVKRQYEQKVNTLETQLHEMSNTCMKQVEEIESLKAENLKLHQVAEEREQLAALYEAKTRELEELQASVAQMRSEENQKNQARLAAFTHRMQRLQEEHKALSERLTQAQHSLQTINAEKQTLENNFKALLSKIEKNDAVIEGLKQKIAVLTEENRELKMRGAAQPVSRRPQNPQKTTVTLHKKPEVVAPSKSAREAVPSVETAPVEMQQTMRPKVQTDLDLPEIRVAKPVEQEDLYNGEDFLEKTDSFIGRMKWSIFREDK